MRQQSALTIWAVAAMRALALLVALGTAAHGLSAPDGGSNDNGATQSDRPNILFVFADDLCWEALGMMNHTVVETPHLDRLASQGLSFTRAYNMGAWGGAVCVASRTMLNSGRFLWRSRRLNMEEERQGGRVWSKRMEEAGYETYFSGKWHVPELSAKKSFHHVTHVRPGMPNQTSEGYNRPKVGEPDPWDPWDRKYGGYWKGGKHWSEVLADDAETFLDQASEKQKPFFMYLAFNAPHDPRQSPERFVNQYAVDEIAIPENFMAKYPYRKPMGSPWNLRDERLAPMPRTEYAIRVNRREYYAIISHMDEQIGRILEALKETGKAENTYIIFTADHGLAVGHHGLMGKQNLFEHSMRVPFFIIGPGIPEGETIDERIYLQDAMATSLELAGQPIPEYVQFKSVMPLIRGDRESQYESIYGGYREHQRAIVDGRFKLILYPKAPKVLLFDLANDPEELNNLADEAQYRDTVRRLFDQLLELQTTAGDRLDLKEAFPELS